MFNKKNVLMIGLIIVSYSRVALHAETVNRDIHINDKDYIEGMMYLEGKKGLNSVLKQIDNCPYEKCRKSDLNSDEVLKTIEIEITQPNYTKAIESLYKAVKKGNFLAADKLTTFLIKRIDYKSYTPNEYLLARLKEDTGLDYKEYKTILNDSLKVGVEGKGCVTNYIYGEAYKDGYLELKKSEELYIKYMKKANDNCPIDSYYKILAENRLSTK